VASSTIVQPGGRVARVTPGKAGAILHNVPWETYCQLRDEPANDRVRMEYLDGELRILMSPQQPHEFSSEGLSLVVRAVASALAIPIQGFGSTTLRLGREPNEGTGKEPGRAFVFGDRARMGEARLRRHENYHLEEDGPPDLAIEVDSSRSSIQALELYARLGVPEVWIYGVDDDEVRFFRLGPDGYLEVGRSVALPVLTPARVIEALDLLQPGMDDLAYMLRVRDWSSGLAVPEV
jgi:Uma2 family endonuclease